MGTHIKESFRKVEGSLWIIVGKAHGKGVYVWDNKNELYDGEWREGMKHGYGLWKGQGGDSYIGEWRENKAHGYGVHTWKNGINLYKPKR
jgi:hypothetical protein